MKYLDIAVVIPTLNEEYFVGNLLDSLALQSVQPKEIVVVDAKSKDNTVPEVRKWQKRLPQLKVYQIPRYSISRQRNFGAKKTRAPHILFIDADMKLAQTNTLQCYFREIIAKNPDIAAARNLPDSRELRDKIVFSFMDLWMKSMRSIWPVVPAQNLYVKRSIFELFDGFDEEVLVGEDCEMVQRMTKGGAKFIFLKTPKFYHSTRRIEKDGTARFLYKIAKAYFDLRKHGYRDYHMDYEFGNFKPSRHS